MGLNFFKNKFSDRNIKKEGSFSLGLDIGTEAVKAVIFSKGEKGGKRGGIPHLVPLRAGGRITARGLF